MKCTIIGKDKEDQLMGEKYRTPIGVAMLAYIMLSGYNTATPEEQEQIIKDAINFAENITNSL